jgi:membrane protein implicated in regulation of membrane protease activity
MTTTEVYAAPARNYLVRLWRGEISLPLTYWVWGSLGCVALRLLSPGIVYLVFANASMMSQFDMQALLWGWTIISFVYTAFILIAIWRSATRHKEKYPDKSWGLIAKISVTFGWIALVGAFLHSLTGNNGRVFTDQSADAQLQIDAMRAGMNKDLPRISRIPSFRFGLIYPRFAAVA